MHEVKSKGGQYICFRLRCNDGQRNKGHVRIYCVKSGSVNWLLVFRRQNQFWRILLPRS